MLLAASSIPIDMGAEGHYCWPAVHRVGKRHGQDPPNWFVGVHPGPCAADHGTKHTVSGWLFVLMGLTIGFCGSCRFYGCSCHRRGVRRHLLMVVYSYIIWLRTPNDDARDFAFEDEGNGMRTFHRGYFLLLFLATASCVKVVGCRTRPGVK